jgi:hypothetical protein
MAHHHVTDFEKPTRPWTPANRHEVLAEARNRILDIPADQNGNIGRAEALNALTDDDPN